MNRLSSVIDSDNNTTTYTYDAVGNRASVSYPNGTLAEYTYDNLNRLTELLNKKTSNDTVSCYKYTLGVTYQILIILFPKLFVIRNCPFFNVLPNC